MKKLLFVLAMAGLGMTVQAQTDIPTDKYSVATNRFWSNWYVGLGFDAQSWYTDQERHARLSKSPVEGGRIGLGGDLQLGKWFTPGIGVRLRGHVGEGRAVFANNIDLCSDTHKYMMWDVQAQAMFNLNNLFCGYNPKRVWTISPYIGAGVAHCMRHNGNYSPIYSVGLFNQFNVSRRFFISLDVYAQTITAEFDGLAIEDANMNLTNNRDANFGASLGVGFNIGRTGWQKTPNVSAIMDMHNQQLAALNQQISEQEYENARLKNMLANRKTETVERVVTDVVPSTPVSVFFRVDSYRIASKKDLVNVQALADAAKARNAKVIVVGYADSKTGRAEYNQELSLKRANALAVELVKMGVPKDNIEINAQGGVDHISPYDYNRRATAQIK